MPHQPAPHHIIMKTSLTYSMVQMKEWKASMSKPVKRFRSKTTENKTVKEKVVGKL
jgi:hypothetical protein